jgi:flagellar assembly protein FliH
MSVAEKFMFDHAFDEDPVVPLEPEILEDALEIEEEPEEIIPTFSAEEVELARQQGHETGKAEGLAATQEALTRQTNETLGLIDKKLQKAFSTQDSANEELSRAALSVAIGICNKMFPALAEKSSFDEINRVIEQVFNNIIEEANIRITVHSSLSEKIKERVSEISETKNYQGRVTFHEDEATEPGNCKVEWSNGGSERNSAELWREINAIVERNLGQSPTIWDEPDEPLAAEPADLSAPEALVDVPPIPETEQIDTAQEVPAQIEDIKDDAEASIEEPLLDELQQPTKDN